MATTERRSTDANVDSRSLALVTGASSGIGYELAKCCADDGLDLIVVADDVGIHRAAESLRSAGNDVVAVQGDLATEEGLNELFTVADGRPIDVLIANAGHGLGGAFLDQDFDSVRHVVDTNITGTLELLHTLVPQMRKNGRGRVLVTGSIAGFMPGSFQAVYNGTKAFVDSFALALREELDGSGVTVTCLMPGATDTRFFERAGMLDTKIGQSKKDSPVDVAKTGYEAMMKGDADVVTGAKNKMEAAAAHVLPATTLAKQHRKQAEPGSADDDE